MINNRLFIKLLTGRADGAISIQIIAACLPLHLWLPPPPPPLNLLLQESQRSKMNGDDNVVFRKRTPQLHTIYDGDDGDDDRRREHRAALRAAFDDWSKQLEASERNLARKQASCSSSKSDLYQILGLFFVFQGVVLTAVAQSNVLHCYNWLFPFLLSLLVSVAAFGAAVQKLKETAELSDQHRLEKALYRALHKSLDALKERGIDFDIEEGQPELKGPYTEEEIEGKGSVENFYSTISRFWSVWVWSYAGAVILLLLLFSALTLIAVPRILCHPGAAE